LAFSEQNERLKLDARIQPRATTPGRDTDEPNAIHNRRREPVLRGAPSPQTNNGDR